MARLAESPLAEFRMQVSEPHIQLKSILQEAW